MYLDVVPAIPMDNDGVPLKAVSITTWTLFTMALAGSVNMVTGEDAPKAKEVVSVMTLSVPPATVAQSRTIRPALALVTVMAWPGLGLPAGNCRTMFWVMPALGRRSVKVRSAPDAPSEFRTMSLPVTLMPAACSALTIRST